MTEPRFEELSKALTTTTSRRQAMKIFGATAIGGVMSLVGAGGAGAIAPGRCRKGGTTCRQNLECCSNFCDPSTGRCACPSGTFECPSSGICVGPCGPGQVFNPTTCACECPAGTTTCGQTCCTTGQTCCSGTCCPRGQVCANGACCINPLTCTTNSDCCTSYRCVKGLCQPCTNPPTCKSSAECCSGYVCAQGGICTPALA